MPRKPVAPPRPTPCASCPLKGLDVFRAVEPAELEFIEWFKTGEFVADEGATLLLEGSNSPHLYTVLSGWAFRYKSLPDGRRQILNFAMPGDFLGVQASMLSEMQHSVEALSRMVLCVFPRDKLWKLYERHPTLAFDLTWLVSRSERMLDDNLLSVGRRSAIERVGFVLLHLFHRAQDLGLTQGRRIKFPFTQQHIADALGLSLVHTNKTLRRLSDQGTIRWKDGVFEMLDEQGLSEAASYEREAVRLRPLI